MSAGPDGGWRPDIERLTERLTEYLRAEGHPWPRLAAWALWHRARGLQLGRAASAPPAGTA
jgi:hypothetical protein